MTLTTPKIRRPDHRSHILKRPDTYIGGTDKRERSMYVAKSPNKIVYDVVSTPPGLIKIFDEILMNAADNGLRARRDGFLDGRIDVSVGKEYACVRNSGMPIPIEKDDGVYLVQLIFSVLLTSSTYDDPENMFAGRNGYGAKLTNIFSTKMEVTNRTKEQTYHQVFENNMTVVHPPTITDNPKLFENNTDSPTVDEEKEVTIRGKRKAKTSHPPRKNPNSIPPNEETYVEVKFWPDFSRFGVSEFTEEACAIMRRMTLDLTFSCRTWTVFNETVYAPRNAKEYMEMYQGVPGKLNKQSRIAHAREELSSTHIPRMEYAVVYCPGMENVSFVNGIRTHAGGVHLDAVHKKVIKILHQEQPSASVAELKARIFLIVSASISSPTFDSQSKTRMEGPPIAPPVMHAQDLRSVLTDPNFKDWVTIASDKVPKYLKKQVKSKVEVRGLVDANDAGTARWESCVLISVEGTSTRGYLSKLINNLPGGREKYGILINTGKMMSAFRKGETVRQAPSVRILCDAMGFENGKQKTKRYGHLWLMSDQDDDGKHVNALQIGIIWNFMRSLFEEERVFVYLSPLIRVEYHTTNLSFYNIESYDAWAKDHPGDFHPRYMKGLGSSTEEDALRDCKNIKLTQLFVTPECEECISDMMELERSQKRHGLINEAIINGIPPVEHTLRRSICSYIKCELMIYAIATIRRALPENDGAKVAWRKLFWAALIRWSRDQNPQKGLIEKRTDNIKVTDFTGFVASKVNYHHGDRSANEAVVHLGCPCCFVNNYPFFIGGGQYGTDEGGLAHASNARYLTMNLNKDLFQCVFSVEDMCLLDANSEDGMPAEPVHLLPIVPISVVNGLTGVALGNYCHIPPFSLVEVCDWLIDKLTDKQPIMPKPFFRGFNGELRLCQYKSSGGHRDSDMIDASAKTWLESEGVWEITKHGENWVNIHISSLGVGDTLVAMEQRLEDLQTCGALRSFKIKSSDSVDINVYHITLKSQFHGDCTNPRYRRYPFNISNIPIILGIRRFISMSHMVTFTKSGVIRHKNVNDLLETFYAWRFPFFEKRIHNSLKAINEKLSVLHNQKRFTEAVINKQIDLLASEDVIEAQMKSLDLPMSEYKRMTISQINSSSVVKLHQRIEQKQKQYDLQASQKPKDLWIADLQKLRKYDLDHRGK